MRWREMGDRRTGDRLERVRSEVSFPRGFTGFWLAFPDDRFVRVRRARRRIASASVDRHCLPLLCKRLGWLQPNVS
jgi:hypothetical protein